MNKDIKKRLELIDKLITTRRHQLTDEFMTLMELEFEISMVKRLLTLEVKS